MAAAAAISFCRRCVESTGRSDRRRGLARTAARAPRPRVDGARRRGVALGRGRARLRAQHRGQPRGAPDQVGLRLPAGAGRLQHRRDAVRVQRARQLPARVRGRHGQHAAGRARRHRARQRARRRRRPAAAVAPPAAGRPRHRVRRGVPQRPAADPAARDLPADHRTAARGVERDRARGRRAAVEGRPADRGARSRSGARCCTR